MPLNGNTLGDEIKAAIDALPGFQQTPHGGETMAAYRTRIERARGNAIVDHITTNAVVHVSTSVVLSAPSACAAGGILSTPPATVATGTDDTGTLT